MVKKAYPGSKASGVPSCESSTSTPFVGAVGPDEELDEELDGFDVRVKAAYPATAMIAIITTTTTICAVLVNPCLIFEVVEYIMPRTSDSV